MTTSTENYTGSGQYIVIIDSGYSADFSTSNHTVLDNQHDISGRVLTLNQSETYVQGSFVEAVILQTASDVNIIHIKVSEDGSNTASPAAVERALKSVASLSRYYDIAAVNLSMTSSHTTEDVYTDLTDEFMALSELDILVTIAAGDDYGTYGYGISETAANDFVVAVSAVNNNDGLTSWTRRSKTLTDITADGIVTVTDKYGIEYDLNGTSYAAPTIAAIAALLQQASLDVNNVRLSNENILEILQLSGRDVTGFEGSEIAGYNVADADAAVAYFLENADYYGTPYGTYSDADDDVVATNEAQEISTYGGADTIAALGGDDTINSGEGADYIDAGEGNNLVFAGDGDDTITTEDGDNTVYGGYGDDQINTDDGGDLLYGESGNDSISSSYGDDTIYGGDGFDTLFGGLGDDLIYGGSQADTIDAGYGEDTVYGDNGRDYIELGGNEDLFIDNDQDDFNGKDTVYGGSGRDTLLGAGGDDWLYGEGGTDSIFGGIGDDTFDGGSGNDTVEGGTGSDSGTLGSGDDIYIDDAEDVGDDVFADYGNDTIYGLGGDDTFDGGEGDDLIYAGEGEDVIYGDHGNDVIYDGSQTDYVDAGRGDDTVYSNNGRDYIDLGVGHDVFYDNEQDDVNGRDTVSGGSGNDTIHSGSGNDLFYGGYGDDVFVFDTALSLGDDTISDFLNGTDLIEMHGVTLADLTITQALDDTLIEWSDGSVTLANVEADKITQDDFVFV